jgi:hypothetical protein
MSESVTERLNELKRHTFYEILDLQGRVFVFIKYSEDVIIGRRGFLAEEKENGLILVFNRHMNFQWTDKGITASLIFGSSVEKCFIPSLNIISVYSPELNLQLSLVHGKEDAEEEEKHEEKLKQDQEKDNVVKVDFKKKK